MKRKIDKNLIDSIDSLLVLGGETEEHTRTNKAHEIYLKSGKRNNLYMVLSGSHYGLKEEKPEKTESEIMKEYLISKGVSENILFTEKKSVDTLGNMVFSRPILDDILSGYIKKNIGLVTDGFHMDRSLFLANKVFPKTYEIIPIPTEKYLNLNYVFREKLIKNAWRAIFLFEGLKKGDQKAFEYFLREKFPLYSKNEPKGIYKLAIEGMKIIRNIKK